MWGNREVRTTVIIGALHRGQPKVREKALRALCQLATSSRNVMWADVRNAILAGARDAQALVRLAALEALKSLSDTGANRQPIEADAE
eukprot:5312451-Prymnesium_polylepis.1